MKILFLTEFFYPFAHGGSEWSTYYLAKALIKKGFKVFITTPNYGAKKRESWQSIDIIRFPFPIKMNKQAPHAVSPYWLSNFLYQTFLTYWLLKTVVKNKIDAIHVQGNYFVPAAYFVSLILKKPIIVTLRDYIALCPYGFCLNKKRNYRKCNIYGYLRNELPHFVKVYTKETNFIRKIFSLLSAFRARLMSYCLFHILKHLDKVICISEKQNRIFRVNGLKNTVVIYNSFENLKISKADHKNYIFFAGRLTPGKGIDLLIKSFREIIKKNPCLKLLIAGDGFLKEEIKSFINQNNLSENTQFLGQIKHQEVLEYISKSKIVVVPSVWEEPFGRMALEALALGVPVVATDKGGLPEIVNDKVTGYIVKADKASLTEGILSALRNNSTIRRNIFRTYPLLINKFQNKVINSYINLYKSL